MNFHDTDARNSDSAPECHTCGRRIPRRHQGSRSRFSVECEACAAGRTAPVLALESKPWRPEAGFYPPLRLSAEQIEAWRRDCETFDEENRGEPTTPEPDADMEYAARR